MVKYCLEERIEEQTNDLTQFACTQMGDHLEFADDVSILDIYYTEITTVLQMKRIKLKG